MVTLLRKRKVLGAYAEILLRPQQDLLARGRRLRQLLAARGMKHLAFAEAMDVNETTVSKWLSGKQGMTVANIGRAAEILGVSPAEIEGGPNQVTQGASALRESAPEYGGASRATPYLEMLDRPEEIRRFDSHLGVGSRTAIVTDIARRENWNRAELFETLDKVREWASQAEHTINDLYSQLRRLGGSLDEQGGS